MQKRPLITVLLCIFLLIGSERFSYSRTSGFMFAKVLSDLPYVAKWDLPNPSKKMREEEINACKQPFFFLGKGNESYAFISKDQRYVLKLFKHHYFRLTFLKLALKNITQRPIWEGIKKERLDRLERSFISCKLAYTELFHETALVSMNLTKKPKSEIEVTLFDRLGIKHTLALEQTEYILQRRAALVPLKLSELMHEGKIEDAKACLDSLVALILKRAKLGIFDRDARIQENFGFLGTEAVEIDTGSYQHDPELRKPHRYKKNLLSDTLDFELWLAENHPELVSYFRQLLQDKVDTIQ
jgi:hypothetical protein